MLIWFTFLDTKKGDTDISYTYFKNKGILDQNKRNGGMKTGIFKRKNISRQVSELMGKEMMGCLKLLGFLAFIIKGHSEP